METQENQGLTGTVCSVCDGRLIDALTGWNHDFYKDVLKCVSCSRMYKIESGELRPYTGRSK